MYTQLGYFLHFQFNFTEKLIIVEKNGTAKTCLYFHNLCNGTNQSTRPVLNTCFHIYNVVLHYSLRLTVGRNSKKTQDYPIYPSRRRHSLITPKLRIVFFCYPENKRAYFSLAQRGKKR